MLTTYSGLDQLLHISSLPSLFSVEGLKMNGVIVYNLVELLKTGCDVLYQNKMKVGWENVF